MRYFPIFLLICSCSTVPVRNQYLCDVSKFGNVFYKIRILSSSNESALVTAFDVVNKLTNEGSLFDYACYEDEKLTRNNIYH